MSRFVPSICIHRSIILIFIEKKFVRRFFSHGKYFFQRFSIFISTRILISATKSRLCWKQHFRPWAPCSPRHVLCGMVWYRSSRVKHLYKLKTVADIFFLHYADQDRYPMAVFSFSSCLTYTNYSNLRHLKGDWMVPTPVQKSWTQTECHLFQMNSWN